MEAKSETITRVFTKYDGMYQGINVPHITDIKPAKIAPDTILGIPETVVICDAYGIIDIEQGLEGVQFVHYGFKGYK